MILITKRRVERTIEKDPCFTCFKPACWWIKSPEEIDLLIDEYEAIRLSDIEGLTMQQWAKKMGISAPTFNRMVNTAHKKITDALISGKTINIHTCKKTCENTTNSST